MSLKASIVMQMGGTGSDARGHYIANQICSDWTTINAQGTATEFDSRFQLLRVEQNKDCSKTYAVQCVKVEDTPPNVPN